MTASRMAARYLAAVHRTPAGAAAEAVLAGVLVAARRVLT